MNKIELKKLIEELRKIRGRHTELISLYIPAGANLHEIVDQLYSEKGTAENIKSKTTRKNVITALEKIINHLKLFKKVPENGLVVFCGNVSPVEGKEDFKLWSIEPIEKLNVKKYWCDQVFVLDFLEKMVEEKDVYGLIVLDASEATIGLLKGKSIEKIKNLESTVPSKSVKGGMSQMRYDRIRDQAIIEFLTKIGEIANEVFLKQENLKGIIIGGPGYVKDQFYEGDYLNYQLKQKVLGCKDIGYTGEEGLKELVKRSEDLIRETELFKEREIISKFFSLLRNDSKNVVYNVEEVVKASELNAIDSLLIAEDAKILKEKYFCQNCNLEKVIFRDASKIIIVYCDNCKSKMQLREQIEITKEIILKVEENGGKIFYISNETEEAKQFRSITNIAAILRFQIN